MNILGDKYAKGVLRSYAFAYHDKDVYTEHDCKGDTSLIGNPKKPHTHFIIRLYNGSNLSTILNWFSGNNRFDIDGIEQNTLCECCLDYRSMYRYLLHLDNPEKYQYNSDVIVTNNSDDFTSEVDCDNTYLALEYMLQGVPLVEIAKKFGRDFIYHYSSYRLLIDDILNEQNNSIVAGKEM